MSTPHPPTGMPESAIAAVLRAQLWRDAVASVALDHEHVQTISLDDLDDPEGEP